MKRAVRPPLTSGLGARSASRAAITAACRRPEAEFVPLLLERARLPAAQTESARALARDLAAGLRGRAAAGDRASLVQGLLQEYALSSQEGVALMCLAEALLRVPDAATRDALIRDKLAAGDWRAHVGHSPSLFVNAASWGLLLSGRLVATHSEGGLAAALARVLARGGEPLLRVAVDRAMRLLGEHFVAGRTIAEALDRSAAREAHGFRHSFDMLGEGARTDADARRYLDAYEQAIEEIGARSAGRGLLAGPGISIKLSALHPRYCRAQREQVLGVLYPRLCALADLARENEIGLNIDAEESDRLELSLDLFEALCAEPAMAGWNGLGFVVQAYQKRSLAVVAHLIGLARATQRRLMVRLVKGAYWDSEIKAAQVLGLEDYPVYTRKAHTDLAWLACARELLAAPDAVFPQFATHNALSLAMIHEMAGHDADPQRYEFQCLHGMGEPLYEQVRQRLGRPCRIYAPVGSHETLLPYLVRRLLENGANTSFVHRVADPGLSLDALLADPAAEVEARARQEGQAGLPHPRLPLPGALYGADRRAARGMDLSSDAVLARLAAEMDEAGSGPPAADELNGESCEVRNPARPDERLGSIRTASQADVARCLARAEEALPFWCRHSAAQRAALLEQAADMLEARMPAFIELLVSEAGKTVPDAVAEVREAVDYLRYYGMLARAGLDHAACRPLGVVACISPWNFPLAIFLGQVSAALAAGNVVLAKPAEQTPLVASRAAALLHEAGVPAAALQLLPGAGETVGARLVADARVRGVVFTGSVAVARQLQRSLAGRLDGAGRPIPLIAETGGINAMVVDSSALPEQVVSDVLMSAFNSAGQRCSALRLLCLQEEIAEEVLVMLEGAMAELRVGDPAELATDVGPLIDEEARSRVSAHVAAMRAGGLRVTEAGIRVGGEGRFLLPALIHLRGIGELRDEVFGPVLHVLRYARGELPRLLREIRALGYGLTQGVHTRIDETIAAVREVAAVGNLYVNRNMVGAVVGVQPFGGEGLSGTGPKAGGPLYCLRLLASYPPGLLPRLLAAQGAEPEDDPDPDPAFAAFAAWAAYAGSAGLRAACASFELAAGMPRRWRLRGPTGERNLYELHPRSKVLGLAPDEEDRLVQLAAVLASGGNVLWEDNPLSRQLEERLPQAVRSRVQRTGVWRDETQPLDAVLFHGDPAGLSTVSLALAARAGPIIPLVGLRAGEVAIPLERLLIERAVSINTTAAGGNAALMTME